MGGTFGLFLGIMPVLKYGIPLIFVPLSLIYFLNNFRATKIKIGLFAFQYCLFQVFITIWHANSADNFFIQTELPLIKSYAVLAFMIFPFCCLIFLKAEKLEAGTYFGLLGSVILLIVDYVYRDNCRASVFSSNPLIPSFIMLPMFGYIASRRLIEGRTNFLDLGLLALMVFVVSAIGGNRMAFYIAICMALFAVLYTTWRSDLKRSMFILIALCLGIFTSFVVDRGTACGFWDRIQNQADIITAKVNIVEDVTVLITSAPESGSFAERENPADNISSVIAGSSVSVGSIETDEVVQQTVTEHSSLQRMVMWSNSLRYIETFRFEWLLGIGRAVERQIANELTGTSYSHVHNQYLSWLLEGGLLGLLSGVLLFGPLVFYAFKYFPVFIFMFAVSSGYLTNSLMLSGEASAQMVLLILFVQSFEWKRLHQEKKV